MIEVYREGDKKGKATIPPKCELYIIDSSEVTLPEGCTKEYIYIQSGASRGLEQLKATLKLK